ncbi:uncharacterized protein LOC111258710 [Varroa jacobsoni]|uniref:uncharacterized protein LOC111258710 n=1 Tax=Varroa jacobsoni TaxID=62625 RepID=UPI000BFA0B14|nr:uncharacterized protein LOC111258710 [Varroa jacobsoni]
MANSEEGCLYDEVVRLQETMSELCRDSASARSESSEKINHQIGVCLARADTYKLKLDALHNKVLEAILSDGDGRTTRESPKLKDYSETIKHIRSKLSKYRRGSPVSAIPPAQDIATKGETYEEEDQLQSVSGLQSSKVTSHVTALSSPRGYSMVEIPEKSLSNTEEPLLNCFISLKEEYASRQVHYLASTMTHFAGDYADFPFFLVEFRRLVHERTEFTDQQKHFILRTLLDGHAARVIRYVPLSDTSYQAALGSLISHYGNCEMIVHCIFANMLALPKIKEADVDALHNLLTRVDRYTSTFEMIKCDKGYFCASMYPQLLRTIPDEMSFRFVYQQKKHEVRRVLNISEPIPFTLEATDVPKRSTVLFEKLCDFIHESVSIRNQYTQLYSKGRLHSNTSGRSGTDRKSKQN